MPSTTPWLAWMEGQTRRLALGHGVVVLLWRSVVVKLRHPLATLSILFSPLLNPVLVVAVVSLLDDASSTAQLQRISALSTGFLARAASNASSIPALAPFAQPAGQQVPDPILILARIVLSVYLVLGFSAHSQSALIEMIVEKEKKHKEGLLMQGLVPWAFWLAVHLVHATYAFIVCALIAYVVQPLFPLSNPVLIFLLLLLLDLTNITSTLLFAPFFTTSKNALLFDGLISILLFTIPTFLIFWQEWAPSEIAIIFSSVVFYPLGFFFGMLRINQLEMEGVGANWENSLDGRGIGGFLIVLTVDVALYGLLSLYLDQIVPQEFGVPRPWFFPLQYVDKKRYDALIVARQTVPVSETSPAATSVQSEDLEADPSGLLQLVHLEGICMRFPGASVNAVENFNLNLYQDEIFALLGHNGAGKTTLLHILTGLVAASSGQGTLAGYDLKNEMSSIRQLIGVCPQYDIHYDDLTVSEHVLLFAGIKGLWATNSRQDLVALVDKALSQMDLLDKKHEMVQALSGGQKRKLSVAMAMVGDPKILVLDEPTAGMDPVSRRSLWSILSKSKKGRVTLLTTHQMDEADLVSDRKAILSQGRIRCLGTSIYLKHRFNVGYKLDISYRVAASSDLHIVSLVNKYIPQAALTSTLSGSVTVNTLPTSTNNEKSVTFSLPPTTTTNFPRLFVALDKQVSGGAVLFYGISAPSLEDVFLKSEGGSLGVSEEVRVAEDYWTRVSTGEAVDEETLLLGNENSLHTPRFVAQTGSLVHARVLMLGRSLSSTVSSVLFPLYMGSVVLSEDISSAASSFWLITMSLGFTAIALARETVLERQTKMDKFLKAHGVAPAIYWLSNLITHALVLLVPGIILAILVLVLDVKAFSGIAFSMFALANIAFSILMMISSYLFGFAFQDPASFLNSSSIAMSLGCILPYSALMYFESMGDPSQGRLVHIVLSFTVPTYPFSSILYLMAMAHTKAASGYIPPLTPGFYYAWENGMLPALLGMVAQSLLYGSALLWLDGAFIRQPSTTLDADEVTADVNRDADEDESEDPNVSMERMRVVKPICTDDVMLRRIWKIYDSSALGKASTRIGTGEEKQIVAVRDLSLGIQQGSILSILGPNGAGKTTTMSIAIGDILPTKGCAAITTLQAQCSPQNVVARASLFGQVAQHDTMWPLLTAREHLCLFASLKGIAKSRQTVWIRMLVDALGCGLSEAIDKPCNKLSGGTKRKFAFLMAIVGKPRVLFLDEPSSGVDPKSKRSLWNLLKSLQPRLTTLLTTHSMLEADVLASRVGIMVNGVLQCLGSPQYLKSAYGSGYILEVQMLSESAPDVRSAIHMNFPNAMIKETFDETMERWEIAADDIFECGGIGKVFEVLEGIKQFTRGGLRDFCFGQVSLEMVFLRFAKKQD